MHFSGVAPFFSMRYNGKNPEDGLGRERRSSMITILERAERESAKDYVVRTLIYNIINTGLLPGEQLLDQEMCEALKVSRTPFREAELVLAQRRLIDIRPKIGTYVSYIDTALVEEVRHLRSVLEAELAVMACGRITQKELDALWENLAVWKLYIEKGQEDRIFLLDKEFHGMLYRICGRDYWQELVESAAPHFDRTTILSFRCKPMKHILMDHEELIRALEKGDADGAGRISRRHLMRYTENIDAIREKYPGYFKQ